MFADRYVIEKEASDVNGLAVVTAAVSLLVGLVYWTVSGFSRMEISHMLAVLAAGVFTLWANALYFMAVPRQQSSIIIVVFQLHPVVVLLLSWLFLQERISSQQLFGFALITLSVLLISLEKQDGSDQLQMARASGLLVISTLMYAVATILLKWVTYAYSIWTVAAYQAFGVALGGLTILVRPTVRAGMRNIIRNHSAHVIGIISLNEGISQMGKLLRLVAISAGPPALVSAVGSTRVVLGVWVGALLTAWAPEIFKEDIRRKSLFKKTLLSILTLVGLLILQY